MIGVRMLFPLIAASAVVPSLLLVWYFHARDLNREPAAVVWATFGLGVATVVPVLLCAWPLVRLLKGVGDPALHGLLDALFTAAVPEEAWKLVVVLGFSARHKEFDEPMDGIVYGAIASLGFATLENILYVAGGGIGIAVMRAVTAVPGHAFMGAIMGSYVARARFGDPAERGRNLALAYVVPVALHAAYDAPLLALKEAGTSGSPLLAASLLVTVGVLVFEWTWTVRLVRALRREQIALQSQSVAMAVAAVATPVEQAAVVVAAVETAQVAAPAYPPPPVNPKAGPLSLVWLVLGAILASVGGLITLAVIVGLAVDGAKRQDLVAVLGGTAIIGVLPLAVGLLLFRLGLKRWAPAR
jgi:RsiW-degrading membrane proteinase PrsW (M82 family)